MVCGRLAVITIMSLFPVLGYAANPFLDVSNDQPVSAKFRGTEWNDEFPEHNIPHEIPLTAQVVTTRIAKTPWGAIFKIDFGELKSRAPKKHEIPALYFIVTDDRIVLLNEENNEAAAKKISGLQKPPEFEPGNIYGITSGKFTHEDGPWTTTIDIKGDECTYLASHNSGHFTKVVWKKNVGLVEYASGYGAEREGFRLKRTASSQKR
jgi:hypothetical protein